MPMQLNSNLTASPQFPTFYLTHNPSRSKVIRFKANPSPNFKSLLPVNPSSAITSLHPFHHASTPTHHLLITKLRSVILHRSWFLILPIPCNPFHNILQPFAHAAQSTFLLSLELSQQPQLPSQQSFRDGSWVFEPCQDYRYAVAGKWSWLHFFDQGAWRWAACELHQEGWNIDQPDLTKTADQSLQRTLRRVNLKIILPPHAQSQLPQDRKPIPNAPLLISPEAGINLPPSHQKRRPVARDRLAQRRFLQLFQPHQLA